MTRQTTKRRLYNPFRGAEYLGHGGHGHIFRLPDTAIAVKIPHRILNGTSVEDARAAENLELVSKERSVIDTLATRPPHPNVVHYFMSTNFAIFMRLEPETLEQRLSRRSVDPIPEQRQFRWIREIVSASSWLGTFNYFHGDLRPENILLDEAEHAKLCDFGRTQKRGCKITVATYPFYRPAKRAVAGPEHEQFAIGSCIYTIRTGEMPYGGWEAPEDFRRMYDALLQGRYPPTEDDEVFGRIVSCCWGSEYETLKDVVEATETRVRKFMRSVEVGL